MTISQQKQQVRAKIKRLLNAQSLEELNTFSLKINSQILYFIKANNWRRIGMFAATQEEPNLWTLHAQLNQLTKQNENKSRFFFPRINQQNDQLEFVEISSKDQMKKGKFGVLEPSAELPATDHSNLDVVFIPGLAFDKKGNRLGRAKGYYDKFLSKVPTQITRVGVCFPFQVIEQVPVDEKDQQVNLVVY